jgi:hypothetical protein
MTNKTIKIDTILTTNILKEYNKIIKEEKRKYSKKTYNIFAIMFILLSIYIFTKEKQLNLLSSLYAIADIYMLYILIWNNTNFINRRIKQLENIEISYEFKENEVSITTKVKQITTSVTVSYDKLSKYINSENLLLLEINKRYYILDKTKINKKELNTLIKILDKK